MPDEVPPILCAHLLRRVDEKLIVLLGSLTDAEWDLQTVAPLWKVRDVAAHLLDTLLRKLSMVRDLCYVDTVRTHSQHDVIALVNRLNQEGVTVYRRIIYHSFRYQLLIIAERCVQPDAPLVSSCSLPRITLHPFREAKVGQGNNE
jgi:hypothetical protein